MEVTQKRMINRAIYAYQPKMHSWSK